MLKPKPSATLTATAGALALGVLLWTPPILAQSNDQVEMLNRLSRLASEVQTLERHLARGGVPVQAAAGSTAGAVAPTQAADFEIRLSQLERNVQEMTGKFEETVFTLAQVRERLDKLSSDTDFRLSQLESHVGTEGGPPPPPRTPPTTTQAAPASKPGQPPLPAGKPEHEPAASLSGPGLGTVSGDVQAQYDEAFGLLRKADYDQAEKALGKFVAQHRDSPLAGNAQYWLGETFYTRGKYAEAAVAFAEGFQKFPKNPKAPDNLLKLGLSLSALGQKDDACKTLKQLETVFPTAAASLKRRSELERKKLGCS